MGGSTLEARRGEDADDGLLLIAEGAGGDGGVVASASLSIDGGATTSSELTRPPDIVNGLRTAESFLDVADLQQRSLALFHEAGRVLRSPRCVNCHSGGDSPLQRNGAKHQPPVTGGIDGFGDALRCELCHLSENAAVAPGAPNWHLAPIEMGWRGKTLGQICAQLKDPRRNGDRTLDVLRAHPVTDPLVIWAWTPGGTRAPAPGTHATFVGLFDAWIASGAVSPEE